MKLWFIPAFAAVAAAAAQADMTATYAMPGSGKAPGIKIEIADNGNYRFEMAGGLLVFIRRDGHTYLVTGAGGQATPLVVDVVELRAVMRESLKGQEPKMCEAFTAMPAKTQLVRQGTAAVRSRTGDAWFRETADGKRSAQPELVISHDPTLAPLAAAFLEEYRASTSMLPDCAAVTAMMAPMQTAMESGAPIAMAGLELVALDTAPVDPKRFELPATPRTAEEIRTAPKPGASIVTVAPPPPK